MQTKNHLTIIFIFMYLIAFSACNQEEQTDDISRLLSEGNWVISNITSKTITPPPTIFIDTEVKFANGGIEIAGPCNQIGGFYEVNDLGKVTRSEVHMTLKDCNSEDEQEAVLLRYFQKSSQLSFDGEYLIMQSLQGEVYFKGTE